MQSPISLSEAREAWLADAHFRRLSPRTIEEYERVSRHVIEHIGNALGHEPALTDLTAASVRDWINQRPLRPASVAAYPNNRAVHLPEDQADSSQQKSQIEFQSEGVPMSEAVGLVADAVEARQKK
jgi:hypothetical protein